LEEGKKVYDAIMDGAMQITQPAFVSMLCICVAFVPMFALQGVAGFLFAPMAMSVVFAMIASFLLSRTLVPTLALYLLKPHTPQGDAAHERDPHLMARIQRKFEHAFEAMREKYRNLLALTMAHRRVFVFGFLGAVAVSLLLFPLLGEDFFPSVDSGQITLHARTQSGTRIEDTAQAFARIQRVVRQVIPGREISTIVDNIGLNQSPINQIYSNSGIVGLQDGDIFIALNPDHHPTADYVRTLRERLPREFPDVTFSFPPPDITSQILNFGAPAPLDIQVSGVDPVKTEAFAKRLLQGLRHISGVADPRLQQSSSYPQLNFTADRGRMAQTGLTERDVTNALATALAGTSTSAPNFWLSPNGVSYPMVAQTPEYRMDTLPELQNLPVTPANGGASQILGGLGNFGRGQTAAVVTHYNIQPTVDIYATTQGRDMGAVAADVQKLIDDNNKFLPRGSTVALRGQVTTMKTAFTGLFFGLLAAVVPIYLLIVVNFQSWGDPFAIITGLPAALAGIVWILFTTGTTLSVPALTGAIMCMGVATANSILVIAFARERLTHHGDAVLAAVEAGVTRFRPVLMTAGAMIIGMLPMALGLGEGGEQNAPLGRAVIGGLLCATCATLLFVPVVFSILHDRKRRRKPPSQKTRPLASPIRELEKRMPDKNPDASPTTTGHREPTREEMLRHEAPPGLQRWGLIAIVVLAVIAVAGIAWRLYERHVTRSWTDDQVVQTVQVIRVPPTGRGAVLSLPGQLQAFTNAPIYAQVSGYVQKWFIDIGATVKQGQLLAQIDPRPYQAALDQAKGSLARDSATLANAKLDLQRYQVLAAQNAISNQQLATQRATVDADAGVVQTDRAAVDNAAINLAYTRIIAPFDGTVTSRNIDIGNLVTAGTPTATPLFTVADQKRLRVYVNVPQNYSAAIRPGTTVAFTVPDYPGRDFQASLVASAGAMVQSTNTMLVQFGTDNSDGLLKPGSYANVKLPLPEGANGIHLPATALIFRDSGMMVAVVTRDNKIAMKPVTIQRDMGASVDLAAGVLLPTDRIVDNPPDSLQAGDTVQVAGK
ncbi:MAG TPA: efflux RND transporter permease subunit, partial [Rhizomicrobium sp.]